MKKIFIVLIILIPNFLAAQNTFTYHLGLGTDIAAYKLIGVDYPDRQSWNSSENSTWFNLLNRYSAEVSLAYKKKVRLSMGVGSNFRPENMKDAFPYAELVLFSKSTKTKSFFGGLAYEHYFNDDARTLELGSIMLSQPGFGPVVGYQFNRLKIQGKFLAFAGDHVQPINVFTFAHYMFGLKLSYNVLNLNTGKRKDS